MKSARACATRRIAKQRGGDGGENVRGRVEAEGRRSTDELEALGLDELRGAETDERTEDTLDEDRQEGQYTYRRRRRRRRRERRRKKEE